MITVCNLLRHRDSLLILTAVASIMYFKTNDEAKTTQKLVFGNDRKAED